MCGIRNLGFCASESNVLFIARVTQLSFSMEYNAGVCWGGGELSSVCCDGLWEGEESDFVQTILLASASRTEGSASERKFLTQGCQTTSQSTECYDVALCSWLN